MQDGILDEVKWLRVAAKNMRRQALNCVFGAESVAAQTLRNAAILISGAATLAENYEAERILREEKSSCQK